MGRPRFFIESLTPGCIRLPDQEAVHAARARRLSAGDEIMLFDGAGHEAMARIRSAGRDQVEAAIEHVSARPRPMPALTLAVAPPKGPRQDVLIEKCTELGTAAIVPLITERSVSSASEHKLDRWRRTAVEAAKQSGQAWLPEFFPPQLLAKAVGRIRAHDASFLASPCCLSAGGAGVSPAPRRDAPEPEIPHKGTGENALIGAPCCSGLAARAPSPLTVSPACFRGHVLVFVGPEGGWAADELDLLTRAGCQRLSLGPNILRIETAAIAVAAMVHFAQRP